MRFMNNRGVTLLELLTTVTVLSILVLLSFPMTGKWREGAQHKQIARDILSSLRRARSMAVHENVSKTFSIDLDKNEYTLDGEVVSLSGNVDIEARAVTTASWSDNGVFSITFRPQGSSNQTLFVRVNQDSDLQVMVDSSATGLGHM